MSNTISKYLIVYDGNDGRTYKKNIYCRYEGVWNGQLWRNEDGTPLDFDCVTDSLADVMSHCIAGIPMDNKYFYWKEIKDFELPKCVEESFDLKNMLKKYEKVGKIVVKGNKS